MEYNEFITRVQHRAKLDSLTEAERATQATLETLGEHISGGERRDLASELPPRLASFLQLPDIESGQLPFESAARAFSLQDFFQRISVREGVPLLTAIEHARAVMSVLREALSGKELTDMLAQLPKEFRPLFEEIPGEDVAL
jgi:uncharacterized protein (DUF2267 family)